KSVLLAEQASAGDPAGFIRLDGFSVRWRADRGTSAIAQHGDPAHQFLRAVRRIRFCAKFRRLAAAKRAAALVAGRSDLATTEQSHGGDAGLRLPRYRCGSGHRRTDIRGTPCS
ncbi:hypothetical protein ACU4GD_07150, partial [Cupriavidus basilensis]